MANEEAFQVVPNSEREKAAKPFMGKGISAALRSGLTIFRPGKGYGAGSSFKQHLRRQGYEVHAATHEIDGVKGVLIWAEKLP